MFRLLVTAAGFQPEFVTKVDPARGTVRTVLKRQDLTKLGPRNKLIGRVVDPKGQPVEGAKVEFEWISDGTGGCGGACDEWGVQPLAVTDADGAFLLTARREFNEMGISVEVRGLARKKVFGLASGLTQVIHLSDGALVTGQVAREGRPLPKVTVGLVSVDRSPEGFTGEYEIATDEEGRFAFLNIPPGQKYFVYTRMSEARLHGGVAPIKEFRSGGDGDTTSVGELSIRPAFRVSGQVLRVDRKPLPAGTRMYLGREEAWDSIANVDVDSDGSFRLEGVPAECVTIGVRAQGYRMSEQNPGLDPLNPFRLIGRVEKDLSEFVILLEPGDSGSLRAREAGPGPRPRERALRGATRPQPVP